LKKTPLRILFDNETFALQPFGGISRYYVELIRRLPTYGITPQLFAPITFNQHLAALAVPGVWRFSAPQRLSNRLTLRASALLSKMSDELVSRTSNFDILHHTYYGRHFSHLPRVACTVVDMIPEVFPHLFPGKNPHAGKLETVHNSQLVFAISENTKQDLMRLVPDIKAPVVVVPLAVDFERFRAHASRPKTPDNDYVLFVGARVAHKNFKLFAKAASQLLQKRPHLRLICVGGPPLHPCELEPFHALGVQSRVKHKVATDNELPQLYSQATCFAFPSLYEGFGLPILEAFASACPVALSDASCFPEIAGEAAAYFDPTSPDSMLDTLTRIVDSEREREALRHRGLERVANYSWDRTASLTAAAYHALT
jgi:glycosyltransferase involved in cell wall biosynthesis